MATAQLQVLCKPAANALTASYKEDTAYILPYRCPSHFVQKKWWKVLCAAAMPRDFKAWHLYYLVKKFAQKLLMFTISLTSLEQIS